MHESVILVLVVVVTRLVCWMISCWTMLAHERLRVRAMVAVLRAAGPRSATVVDRRPDGGSLSVRTDGGPVATRAAGARR